jgi:hypothetical protein
MKPVDPTSSILGAAWKVPFIALAYVAALHVSGAVVSTMALPWPEAPGSLAADAKWILDLAGAILLASCLVPLAAGIRGSTGDRWLILAGFTYVCLGVNNQLEGATYSTIGGTAANLVFFILPCFAIAAAAVVLVKPPHGARLVTTVFTDRPPRRWWWRAVAAVVAFPVIFFIFGALAFPLVADTYAQPESALVVPGPLAVLRTVFVRSLFFLVATAPVLMTWARSRRCLVLVLSGGFFVMVGAVGLIGAHWLPPAMRMVHAVEILADSVVYSWLLVALLAPKPRTFSGQTSAATAN